VRLVRDCPIRETVIMLIVASTARVAHRGPQVGQLSYSCRQVKTRRLTHLVRAFIMLHQHPPVVPVVASLTRSGSRNARPCLDREAAQGGDIKAAKSLSGRWRTSSQGATSVRRSRSATRTSVDMVRLDRNALLVAMS
jgi:hypothetical protein